MKTEMHVCPCEVSFSFCEQTTNVEGWAGDCYTQHVRPFSVHLIIHIGGMVAMLNTCMHVLSSFVHAYAASSRQQYWPSGGYTCMSKNPRLKYIPITDISHME